MDDLINRQAAIDAVNETIADYIPTLYGRYEALPLEMAMAIKRLPSSQPGIIRCKECLMHGVCRFEQGLGLDGYCSQAERRSNG